MLKILKIFRGKKIEKKIFSRILLSILPMLAMVIIHYISSKGLPENNKVIIKLICENGANEIKRFYNSQKELFKYWISDDIFGMSIEFQTIEELQKHFTSLLDANDGFTLLALTDLSGKVIITSNEKIDFNPLSEFIINDIKTIDNKDIFFEKYIYSQNMKNLNDNYFHTLVFGFKTKDTSGKHNGYFLAYIDWSKMDEQISNVYNKMKNKGFKDASLALIEHNSGIALSHSRKELIRKKIYNNNLLNTWLEEGKFNNFQMQVNKNYPVFVSFFLIDNSSDNKDYYNRQLTDKSNLSLAVFVPENLIMSEVRKIFWTSAISATICAIFVIFIGFLISKAIKVPLDLAVAEINTASEELKIAAKHQLANTGEQVTATTQLNTNIEEQVASSRQMTDIANNFVAVAENTNTSANMGKNSLEATVSGVKEIKSQVEKIAENMLSLNEKTQQMNIALDIINELSAQTTILSYNATIEAAGAGESGKRFSAIAEQIMKLANKATDSTKDIAALVEDMQKGGNKTILTTEDGLKSVDRGMKVLLETVDHFDSILTSADENLTSAKEMDMTISQQTNAIEQAADAIRSIQTAAEDVKISSEETLRTAEQMLSMSRKLAEL